MLGASRLYLFALSLTLVLFFPVKRTCAKTLIITSSPSGATVELDGIIGATPYRVEYPGDYFHKPHSAFGDRLEHAIVLRIYKTGYMQQRIPLTDGPFEWVGFTGKHHGNYWVLKSDRVNVKLEPAESWGSEETSGPLPVHREDPSSHTLAEKASEGSGTVKIVSDSPGADIFVDGKFVGQTPSTIHIASGIHRIEVKASGKEEWTREVEILKDSEITLHPVFE